jgi:hypothetical protein
MTQFDVFANPVQRARRAYPYVVVLQADVAQLGRDRAVAPVAPHAAFPAIAGRLTPVVTIERNDYVLLVTSLTTLPALVGLAGFLSLLYVDTRPFQRPADIDRTILADLGSDT